MAKLQSGTHIYGNLQVDTYVTTGGNILSNVNTTTYNTANVGALVLTTGGAYIGGNAWINGNIITSYVNTPAGTNANLVIDPDGWGYFNTSALTPVLISNTYTSISSTSGAITVLGGMGIGGNIYAGGGLNSSAGLYATGVYNGGYTGDGVVIEHSNSFAIPGARFSGGTSDGYGFYNAGVGGTELFRIDGTTGNIVIASTTNSTTPTTGALVVKGGVGVGGDLILGTATGTVGVSSDSGGSISMGLVNGTGSTPYIDFNTSTSVVDYNVRLQASGSSAALGAGTLTVTAGNVVLTSQIWDDIGDLRDMPQNSQSANPYTLVSADAGRHINYSTNSGSITIPISVFSPGQAITIFNNTATNITITIAAGTLRLAGTATTGTRTLAQYGLATAICIVGGATPTFVASGVGLT